MVEKLRVARYLAYAALMGWHSLMSRYHIIKGFTRLYCCSTAIVTRYCKGLILNASHGEAVGAPESKVCVVGALAEVETVRFIHRGLKHLALPKKAMD